MKHLEAQNILYDLQHGFRHGRSCETQLVSLAQDLLLNFDKNIQYLWTFLRLSIQFPIKDFYISYSGMV